MSQTPPDIGTALSNALTAVVDAIAGIIQGVASAVSQYANTIGTIVVIGGLATLVIYTMFRGMPFIRGLFGRLFRV